AIAARASTTSFASSASSCSPITIGLPIVVAVGAGRDSRAPLLLIASLCIVVGAAQQDSTDPQPPAMVRAALGVQPQPVRHHLRAGQRNPAQLQRKQAADRVDVEILLELHAVELAEILDRQSRRYSKPIVAQVLYRC